MFEARERRGFVLGSPLTRPLGRRGAHNVGMKCRFSAIVGAEQRLAGFSALPLRQAANFNG
jgi:hypothetical protein